MSPSPPTLDELKIFFTENGYTEKAAEKAFVLYSDANWFDTHGNKIVNWKNKMRNVWFKPENLINAPAKPEFDPVAEARLLREKNKQAV